MAGDVAQPCTVAAELDVAGACVRKGGSECPDIGNVLCGCCAGGPVILVRSVGDVLAHLEDLGRIPLQGGPQNDEEATAERTVNEVVLSPAGGGDCSGSTTGGGDLHLPSLEHIFTVHIDQAHYLPISDVGETPRDKGVQVVVVAGRHGLGGDADDFLGGGTGGEGGKVGWDSDGNIVLSGSIL